MLEAAPPRYPAAEWFGLTKQGLEAIDVEDETAMEVSPEYARNEYRSRIDEHMRMLSEKARAAGLDYVFMNTAKPLDEGLRDYLAIRQRRL